MGKLKLCSVGLVLLSLCCVTGCGVEEGLKYEPAPSYDENKTVTPYSIKRFENVLDKCKLHYIEDTISNDKLVKFKGSYFYAKNDTVFFGLDKSKTVHRTRCELRCLDEWQIDDTTVRRWHSRLRCYIPEKGISAYTWMQIHGTLETFNYPIVRLLWVRQRQGKSNHIWAIIIVSNPYDEDKKYEWIDLGKKPGGYFDADVDVSKGVIKISINGKVKKSFDASYWKNVDNYFKTGVYVNRHDDVGKAVVGFKELEF